MHRPELNARRRASRTAIAVAALPCATALAWFLGAATPAHAAPAGDDAPDGAVSAVDPEGSSEDPEAAATADDEQPPLSKEEAQATVEAAIEAWRAGQWTQVRDLLEPYVRDAERIVDPFLREQALRYLAEATLYDPGLDGNEREALARGYIERILDQQSTWTPPSGIHGRLFYDLAGVTKAERDSQAASACQGQLLTCEADLGELDADHRSLIGDHATLQDAFDSQLVERTQVIQRNRGLALIPFGVGHFTGGRLWLGGLFVGLEAVTGGAGLALILTRNTAYGCQRTAGFQPGSLICTVDDELSDAQVAQVEREIETIRDVEQAMGIAFLSLVVLDVALSQVLFERFEVVRIDEVPRNELTSPTAGDDSPSAGPGDPAGAGGGSTEASAKMRLRPSPVFFSGPSGLPAGGGLGLRIQF